MGKPWNDDDRSLLLKLVTPNARLEDIEREYNAHAREHRTRGALCFLIKGLLGTGLLADGQLAKDVAEESRIEKQRTRDGKAASSLSPAAAAEAVAKKTKHKLPLAPDPMPEGYEEVSKLAEEIGSSTGWIESQSRAHKRIRRERIRRVVQAVSGPRLMWTWVYHREDAARLMRVLRNTIGGPRLSMAKAQAALQQADLPNVPIDPPPPVPPPAQDPNEREAILQAVREGRLSLRDAQALLMAKDGK